jgi:diguanylate cyclase
MQYHESREQSAEILRIALEHMGRQKAAFNPASYTLWYEHVAGINPALSEALETCIATGTPLTDADVVRLYGQFIVTPDGKAIERIRARLMALLKETAQIVSSTGSHATQFGEALEDHSLRLKQPVSLAIVQEIVNELFTETQHMCAANAALSNQLNSSSQEVLQLTQRLERMQAEALNDPLTGLLNRRGFEQAIRALDTQPGELEGTSLLAADVDRFKQINDAHGHLVGDQVLRAVAQVLRARTKGADIAARVGGDEFVVLLPETPMKGALALAEQIRTTLVQGRLKRVGRDGYIENITLSVGVAEAGAADRFLQLMHRADAALYQAKRAGRDRVVSDNESEKIS